MPLYGWIVVLTVIMSWLEINIVQVPDVSSISINSFFDDVLARCEILDISLDICRWTLIAHSNTNVGGKSTHSLPTYHKASSHLQPHNFFERSGFRRFSPAKFDWWTLDVMAKVALREFLGRSQSVCVLCCVETPAEPLQNRCCRPYM